MHNAYCICMIYVHKITIYKYFLIFLMEIIFDSYYVHYYAYDFIIFYCLQEKKNDV